MFLLSTFALIACDPNSDREDTAAGDSDTEALPDECGSLVPDGFALIRPGTFTMGSPPTEPYRQSDPDESQHQVTLTRPFLLATHEVTHDDWAAVFGWLPSCDNRRWGWTDTDYLACPDCPANYISWWMAAAYLNERSIREGLTPCYVLTGCDPLMEEVACNHPNSDAEWACDAVSVEDFDAPGEDVYACDGYRFPTEAEWEYAYRAGTTTALYTGALSGDRTADDAIVAAMAVDTWPDPPYQPVGSMPPNPWGLYDMAGNVMEHVWDAVDEPTYDWYREDRVNPLGPPFTTARVQRGGAEVFGARAAWRSWDYPEFTSEGYGIRVARSFRCE